MTLTPQVQTLVDQLVQQLGLQALRPSGIEIHLDREGIVHEVKPKLTFRRVKEPSCDHGFYPNALDKRRSGA